MGTDGRCPRMRRMAYSRVARRASTSGSPWLPSAGTLLLGVLARGDARRGAVVGPGSSPGGPRAGRRCRYLDGIGHRSSSRAGRGSPGAEDIPGVRGARLRSGGLFFRHLDAPGQDRVAEVALSTPGITAMRARLKACAMDYHRLAQGRRRCTRSSRARPSECRGDCASPRAAAVPSPRVLALRWWRPRPNHQVRRGPTPASRKRGRSHLGTPPSQKRSKARSSLTRPGWGRPP